MRADETAILASPFVADAAAPDAAPQTNWIPNVPTVQAPVRLAVVGYGYWGPKLAATFAHLPHCQLQVIADVSPERRQAARQEHPHCTILSHHREALSAAIDAFVIATPAGTHASIVVEALEAGKHVFVEKPLAPSLAEVELIAAVERRQQRRVMVGHTFLYHPAVETLTRLIDDGVLGALRFVRSTRANLGLYQPDVSVIWDLAVHDVSVILAVARRMPTTVRAIGRSVAGHGTDVAWLELVFADGLAAHIHVSWIEPEKSRHMTLVGDRRMAVFDDLNSRQLLSLYDSGVERLGAEDDFEAPRWLYRRGDAEALPLHREAPLLRECRHFVQCLRSGQAPRTGTESGRRVVAVLEAAEQSMATSGQSITLAVQD